MDAVTTQGQAIAGLFNLAMGLSALVLLLVVVLVGTVMVRFRARPGSEDPPQVEGNRRLETAWTLGAFGLVLFLSALAFQTMGQVSSAAPSGARRIEVIGHQWWWEFRYVDDGVVTANELRLPVGEPVDLLIQSADVIHSFWVPQFGWKQDAVPGRTNRMRVQLTQAGTWDGACSEFCGVQHAWMRISVRGEAPAAFDQWLQAQRAPAAQPRGEQAQRGKALFEAGTCASCHAIRGTSAAASVGPDLTHVASRPTLGAGVLENSPANLQRWIQQTQLVKPGVLMPSFDLLSEADLQAITAYLGALQ